MLLCTFFYKRSWRNGTGDYNGIQNDPRKMKQRAWKHGHTLDDMGSIFQNYESEYI